jgi:DNA-binding SARP family transcriptional activator
VGAARRVFLARVILYRVLGPVELSLDGSEIALPSAKLRALLAVLLLEANRTVSTDRLIEALWDETPPRSARKNLHQYVHRLRALLGTAGGAHRLLRRTTGYSLTVRPGELDLERFESLAQEGRDLALRGEAEPAADRLRAALAVWRGSPLADVPDCPALAAAAHVLRERRLAVVEQRVAAAVRAAPLGARGGAARHRRHGQDRPCRRGGRRPAAALPGRRGQNPDGHAWNGRSTVDRGGPGPDRARAR